MPKIPGNDRSTGRVWNETYKPHDITHAAVSSVIKSSYKSGRNGAAVEDRIAYMRRAMNIGLVRTECLPRAAKTIANLEAQL